MNATYVQLADRLERGRYLVKNLKGTVFSQHDDLDEALREARKQVFAVHVIDRETGCAVGLEPAS